MSSERPQVLFVCVHNAGRSQMAAAFLSRIGDGRIDVRSAGSTPAEEIHPVVVQAMEEVRGIRDDIERRIAELAADLAS